MTEPTMSCSLEQMCVVQTDLSEVHCFSPPCLPRGVCVHINQARQPQPHPPGHAHCVPNAATLAANCAKVTLVFDKVKMPPVSPRELFGA